MQRLIVCLAVAGMAGACGGNNVTDPTIIGSGSTGLSGVWVGTLSRPAGLGSVTVRFQGTHSGNSFTGPATFTYNGVTVAGTIGTEIAGSPATWYAGIAFNDPTYPNCKASQGTSFAGGYGNVPNVRTDAKTLVSDTFALKYTSCSEFIGQASVDEATQLSLTKQ